MHVLVICYFVRVFFFFFKQKTAYEMRISDWSSDVCSSDLLFGDNGDVWMGYTQSSRWQVYNGEASRPFRETNYEPEILLVFRNNYSIGGWKGRMAAVGINHPSNGQIGRASCRESVCQYV